MSKGMCNFKPYLKSNLIRGTAGWRFLFKGYAIHSREVPEAICKHEAMVGGSKNEVDMYMPKVEVTKCVISDSARVSWSREIQTRKKKCHSILSEIRSGFCTTEVNY